MATDQHDRQRADQRQRADDLVEQPFHHDVPVGDRLVEDVEHRDVADIGIGARAEAQLVGVRGEADVDRQHPELLEHLQDAAFRRDRQREDHQIDAGVAGELHEIVDGAELGHAGAARRAALVAAVVEHADDADVGIALRGERADQRFAVAVGADHDGAAVEPAFARPAPHQQKQPAAERDQREQAEHVEAPSQARENWSPALAKNDTPMAIRNTTDHAEASRMYCFSWPRNAWT